MVSIGVFRGTSKKESNSLSWKKMGKQLKDYKKFTQKGRGKADGSVTKYICCCQEEGLQIPASTSHIHMYNYKLKSLKNENTNCTQIHDNFICLHLL